jgi:hypothetical protein
LSQKAGALLENLKSKLPVFISRGDGLTRLTCSEEMEIPITSQRKILEDITFYGSYNGQTLESFLKTTDKIKRIKEMDTGESEMCCWFIFKREPWFKKMYIEQVDRLLMKDPEIFLQSMGYTEVEAPEKGDIVVYLFSGNYEGRVGHYGKYIGKGKVRSKFGKTHVYEHDIAFVLASYGDRARFFHKSS